MTTILITDITSYKAVVVARYLRSAYPDVRLVATDHRTLARVFHTRQVSEVKILPCSPSAGEPYAIALGKLIRDENVDFLLPVNSSEIRILSEFRKHLGTSLDYIGPQDLYQRLDDKSEFANLIDRSNLPQPKNHASIAAPLPLVVKPARGSSARGVTYLVTEADRTAFRNLYGETPVDFVIQDYIIGDGIGYSGFFKHGQILVGYAHKRVAEYPVSGGSSVVRERYPYDDLPILEALVNRLLDVAPWSGFAMFELKRRGPGDFVFIECNPRIWGSIHQGLVDGANYFEPLLGPAKIPIKAQKTGCRTSLLPLDLLALAGYARRGRYDVVMDVLRGVFRTRPDIHPLLDPLGFLALLMRGA